MILANQDRQAIAADLLAPAVAALMDALDVGDEEAVAAHADEAVSALAAITTGAV